jgi:hypothetical protein
MVTFLLGVMFLATQLSGPAASLPQIVKPAFKASAPIKSGKKGEVTVSFGLLNGYAINHTPPMTLKLTKVSGITLAKTDFSTPTADPKSKDEYYVDLPTIKVPVTASKTGNYEIPGKLTYFFCSKADGFCSRQVLDVKIPVTAE